MNNLSDTLSILIPMYNEEATISDTINELKQRNLHKRYRIIICDDDSTDKSVTKARQAIEDQSNISIIVNTPNGKKIDAIKTGLQSISTPYVLLLDADSMIIEIKQDALDGLVRKMQHQRIDAMGFKVRPSSNNLIEHFQAIEYMIATDGLRRLLGVIPCLAGLGSLWNVKSLETVLSQHSGIFEGDDLESTMLTTILGFKTQFESYDAIVNTKLKKNLIELFKQRTYIWDVGLIRTFVDTPGILKKKGREGAFFRSVFVTEVLTHPFKIISILGLFLVLLIFFMVNLDLSFSNFLIPRLSDTILEFLYATIWLYILLWLINTIMIGLTIQSFSYGLLFIFYFTYYMATPLVPLMTSNFSQALGFTYLWWYIPCVFLILISIDSWKTKLRASVYSLFLPFYFAFLLALPRTIGFIQYILGRMRGLYRRGY